MLPAFRSTHRSASAPGNCVSYASPQGLLTARDAFSIPEGPGKVNRTGDSAFFARNKRLTTPRKQRNMSVLDRIEKEAAVWTE